MRWPAPCRGENRQWCCLVCRRWAAAWAAVVPAAGETAPSARKVTRTRGPDAAESAARAAELMLGVRVGPAQKRFKNHLCDYAETEGHVKILRRAQAKKCPLRVLMCAWATAGGNLEVLN